MSKDLEFTIDAYSEKYNPSDSRWIEQVNDLISDCQRQVGRVRAERKPQEGMKGGFESIVVALGTGGAITAAVDLFKAWLSRDQSRCLKVKFGEGAEAREFELTGVSINEDVLQQFVKAAKELRGE